MPIKSRFATWILAVAVAAPVGCYDGAVLLSAHRSEADTKSLAEVDLGEFRVSLAAPRGAADAGHVEFHVFGQVARRNRDEVVKLLAQNEPEWRRRMLLLVRGLASNELDEPKLETLRSGIVAAANAALGTKLIKNVGFYRFSFAAR